MTKEFKVGSLNGAAIVTGVISIVNGVSEVEVNCEVGSVLEGLASKTENKIDDALAAVAKKALSGLTKEIAEEDLGTIHGHKISKVNVSIVSGVADVSFSCDVATTAEELASCTDNKIDDVVVGVIAEILKKL
jgi:hypothetical protein